VKLTSLPDPVQKTIMLNNDEAAAVKAGTADIKTTLNLTRPLTAPVAQGDVFGTVDFTINGASVGSAKLAASREVFQVGDEQAQSVALGESPLAYWAETNLGGIDKNPAVLWWLLVPAIAIMLLMMRTVSVNRRKSRATARLHNSISRYSYSYHRPIHRRPRYKGRYR